MFKRQICKYQNCNYDAKPNTNFCSDCCERYYWREKPGKGRTEREWMIIQRNRRKKLVLQVVTGYWKTNKELYDVLRIEGYEATLKTLQRDLNRLEEEGLVEKRTIPPDSTHPMITEWRSPILASKRTDLSAN